MSIPRTTTSTPPGESGTGTTSSQRQTRRRPETGSPLLPVCAAVLLAAATVWLVQPQWWPLSTASGGFASLLSMVEPALGRTLYFALAAVGMVVALAMVTTAGRAGQPGPDGRRAAVLARALTGVGAVIAVALLVGVPDASALALVGYLPLALVTAPFDAAMRQSLADSLSLSLLLQVLALVAAAIWARESVTYWRRAVEACGRCGRTAVVRPWTTPVAAARWGRWAVVVGVLVPVLYAVTRLAWTFGFALGIDPAVLEAGAEEGRWLSGAWLASFALLGAVLTLGLVQRWGEVFPRWLPGVAGRSVPIRLATVPATIVAALLVPAGVSITAAGVDGSLLQFTSADWGTYVPMVLWPAWAVALGAATYAYHLRRRPWCTTCGRG